MVGLPPLTNVPGGVGFRRAAGNRGDLVAIR